MEPFHYRSMSAQLAEHLRNCLLRGMWQGEMPGTPALAKQLGVDERAITSAFSQLEMEGLLASQGAGRRRKITLPHNFSPPALRVHILPYEQRDRHLFYLVELQHQLIEMGHVVNYAPESLQDIGMDLKRLTRLVAKTQTDAWIVFAASRDILEWFSQQPTPAFALAGRRRNIPMAGSGPDKIPALREAVRSLTALGHRRIVLLTREERRKPGPAYFERTFLEELNAHGIHTGDYNLPNWANNTEDFHRCLDALFRHTPPTALLIDEYEPFIATQLHLAQHGILAPRDVSLVCTDPSPAFEWCRPSPAHIHWDADPMVRRVVSWASHVARGQIDCRQTSSPSRFIAGGTIGPAPQKK